MMTSKQRFLRTASEIAMGRLLRAPDHDASSPVVAAPESNAAEADDADFAAFERRATAPKSAEPAAPKEPAAEAEEPEAGENGTGDEGGPSEEGEQPARKGKSVQDRIDEVTAARRQAEREREEARQQADYWRGVAEGRKPDAEAAKSDEPKAEAKAASDEPDPAKYEYGEADPKYVVDLARYGARKEFEQLRQQETARTERTQIEGKWETAKASAVEKYPDFKEKVLDAADRNEWACPPVVAEGIKLSEVGADVAYHLANNRDEAKSIAMMHPLEQARAFGRLEARFLAEAAAKVAEPKPEPKVKTDAPEPPTHRARGGGGKFSVDDDTSDFAAFEAKHARGRK